MTAHLARPRSDGRAWLWALLALLIGLAAGAAPLPLVLFGLGGAAFAVLTLVEPSLALVAMLAVAPLKTLIATEAPLALPADPGQWTLAWALGAWLLWRVSTAKHRPLPRTALYAPLLLIMAGFAPSLWNAQDAGAWLSEMLKWAEMLLLIALVVDLGRTRWEWIAFGAVFAGTLQALLGLYEFYGGSGAPHLWIADFQHFRAFGTFGQPNPFSAFMGLTLPLALGLAWGYAGRACGGALPHTPRAFFGKKSAAKKLKRAAEMRTVDKHLPRTNLPSFRVSRRVPRRETGCRGGSPLLGARGQSPRVLAAWYALSAALLLGGLVASWGRGAWLGFAAAAAVMLANLPRRRALGVLSAAALGALMLGLWGAGLLPMGVQARLQSALDDFSGFHDMRAAPVNDENFAIVERLAHWQAALNMADARPWLGVGLGNYEAAYPRYGLPSWPRPLGHAHNDYLNTLAETGLLGLSAYLFGWALIFGWTLRALRARDPLWRGLALGLLGVWTHLAVHSLVDKLYVNNLFLYLGVTLGLLALARQHIATGENR